MSEPNPVLRAVIERPGCSAWALGVLANPPEGMGTAEWKGMLERELPRLHAEGLVKATRHGVGRVSWWPAEHELHPWAGELVPEPAPIEVAPIDEAGESRPA